MPVWQRSVEWLCNALAVLGLTALLIYAALTLANGVMRTVFLMPIDVVGDAGNLMVAVSVASCFPLAMWRKSNIRIDFVSQALPPLFAYLVGMTMEVIVLVVSIAMARQMIIFAQDAAENGDTTALLAIPSAPFWSYVAAMFCIAAVAQAAVTVKSACDGLGHRTEPHSHVPGRQG